MVEVGPQHAIEQIEIAAKNAVLIRAFDGFQVSENTAPDAFLSARSVRRRWIEERLEHLHHVAGHARVSYQGLFHIGLGKRYPCLQEIFADCTQHHDFTRRQSGMGNKGVETVAFHLANPDALEGVVKVVADSIEIDTCTGGRSETEIVDGQFAATSSRHVDYVRSSFINHLETQMLEHGQHVGKRYGVAEMIELETNGAGARTGGLVEVHADAAGSQDTLDLGNIVQDLVRFITIPVAGAKRFAVALEKSQPLAFAVVFRQYLANLIAP